MKRTRLTFKNREEWLSARSEGIGASEAGTILGLNPFETPYQLWLRKRGQLPSKPENMAMKLGHYMEDTVAKCWSDETGLEIIKSSVDDFMFINPDKPYLRVSPDRTYWLAGQKHNDDNKGILECKTTQLFVDPDDIPKHWFCQVQMNLGVAGLQHGSLAWLTCGRDFGYRNIEFLPDFYEYLEETITKFYVDNIVGGQEPLPINSADILLKYPKETEGKVVEATDKMIAVHDELTEIKAQMKVLENMKAEHEEEIKLAMGDAEALVRPDVDRNNILVTWRAPKNGGNRRFLVK